MDGPCDPGLMDRFFDGEVEKDERGWCETHLAACQSCRNRLEGHRAVARQLASSLDQALTDAEKTTLEERVIAQVRRESRRPWAGINRLLTPKRLIPRQIGTSAPCVLFRLRRSPLRTRSRPRSRSRDNGHSLHRSTRLNHVDCATFQAFRSGTGTGRGTGTEKT